MNNDLNIGNLELHRGDILKAEIGALLFNLGKTHIGFWKEKNGVVYFNIDENTFKTQFGYSLFGRYKKYYEEHNDINKSPFEYELEKTNSNLRDFIFKEVVRLPDNSDGIAWKEFFFGDSSSDDFIKKIFFRGCENINSGIDKGSPQESNQLKTLWISNAFGSLKKEVTDKNDFDASRLCFLRSLHRFIEDNNYYNSPDWVEIRNFVFKEIKPWYSRLLSDSRFPVNDVTLWEQAYMTASMFKATLAGLYLNNSRQQNFINNPQTIKWSILGIQYDKLGLAEKGLKAASIQWYRNLSEEVDEAIKKVIEIEYPLGNEVYRDETGIYFVVADNVKGKKEGDFYKLHNNLSVIKTRIQNIFADKFGGEVYPAIFLAEPSRGLMNLGHLVEEARENFLKAEYKQLPKIELISVKFKDNKEEKKEYKVHKSMPYINAPGENKKEPNTAIGICPICKMRLVFKSDLEKRNKPPICETCHDRIHHSRVNDWDPSKETIWIDELQDKNGRVALITLKFELDKWINGDLVNSLLVRNEDYNRFLSNIKSIFSNIKSTRQLGNLVNFYNTCFGNIKVFLQLFDKNGIQKPFESILKDKILRKISCQPQGNLKDREIELKDLFFRSLNIGLIVLNKQIVDWIDFIKINFSINPNFDFNTDRFKNQAILKNNNFLVFVKASFVFGFIIFQVYQLILERSIGSEWEKFITDNLSDKTAIDFDNRKIDWNKLNNDDIDFLSQLLLQFLLRKNPSPARLRRIWETTREFFKDLSEKITELAKIPEERRKRLVWNNIDIEDREYQDGDILFWAKDKTVYLISSIEKLRDKSGFRKNEFKLKRYDNKNDTGITLNTNNSQIQPYKPYFTILSPTPISWQFIIPAEYVPNLIKNVQKEYYKNFKWVYGKLPLHIGTVAQNYKRPLYVGIKALRRIRRDKQKWEDLKSDEPENGSDIHNKINEFNNNNQTIKPKQQELDNNTEVFYSLFERRDNTQKQYEFYLYPHKNKVWIDTTQNSTDTDKFNFYPNTFDFEFLDINTRRNDIYYKKAKRAITYKQNRPYDIEDWQYFEKFREYFKDKKTSSKLHKLVSLIYSKLEDWKGDHEAVKTFMLSAFTNILGLNQENRDKFAGILGLKDWDEFKNLEKDKFIKKLYMFLDMFEFWHTTLKEV